MGQRIVLNRPVEQSLSLLESEPTEAIVLVPIECRVEADRHLSCERHHLHLSYIRTVDPVPAIAKLIV